MFRRLLTPLPPLRTSAAINAGSARLNNTFRHFTSSQHRRNMSDLKLYSFPTPNGVPISIFLEELKEAYGGPEYEVIKMSIRDSEIGKVHNQVKQPWFIDINPNGRIPAITHNGFSVFETSAILLYLAAQFDKESKFSWDPKAEDKFYSEELQWLFFAHGGIGPMQGQANHFIHAAPEKIQYGVDRYTKETRRLYEVLEIRLSKDGGRDYLVGEGKGKYSIADLKAWSWVRIYERSGIDITGLTHVKAWIDRIAARPASQKGLTIPPAN